jgi:AcrR family transcriptional regulator
MPRWEPDARQRLRTTALELFAEHGYENVSAEQIAEQAGLTRRTFFRHFPDKRDVLFAGSEQLPGAVADAIRTAPGELGPADAARAGLLAIAARLEELLEPSPTRLAVIASSPELRERESWKHEAVAEAITVALRERGADDADPVLLGRIWAAVLRTAFEHWVQQPAGWSLADRVQQLSAQLSTLGGATATR